MTATLPIEQQHTSAGRVIRLFLSDNVSPPVDPIVASTLGPVITVSPTLPDVVTSPLRADGQTPTTGVMYMLKEVIAPTGVETPATPTDPLGFLVTVWVRNPVNGQWGDSQTLQVPFGEWIRTFDFNGGDLFFQVTGADDPATFLDVHVVEL